MAATAAGRLLESDSPGSMRPLALMYGDEWLWRAYGRAHYSVQTGAPAFDLVHGEPLFDFLTHHETAAAVFHAAMTGFSRQEVDAILAA